MHPTAASAQLASLSREPHLEWDINQNPFRTVCFTEPFRGVDGFLELNADPGIVWEIRKEIFEKWTVSHIQVII